MKKVIKQCMVILCMIAFLTVNLYATTIDKLEDEIEEVKENINKGVEEVKDLEGQLVEMNAVLVDLDQQMIAMQLVIEDYANQLVVKQGEIDAAKIALEGAIVDEAEYKEEVLKRIKVMYEYGDSGYIDVLLEANNLGDFFTRLEYLTQILNYDDNMFEKLEGIQLGIENQKAQLELEEANLGHLKAEADLKKSELDGLYIEKSIQTELIESNTELLILQIEKWEAEEKAFERELELEIAREKERLRKLSLKTLVFKDGEFKYPLPGRNYLSSYFGPRVNPISRRYEVHNGIDIPAPGGTEILAAAEGIVITAKWNNSYGNVIVINHGSSKGSEYLTLYAHSSKLLVKAGEAVRKGQVIALVGTTGNSTGNHLHFSIQKDGKWVNPLNYFNF